MPNYVAIAKSTLASIKAAGTLLPMTRPGISVDQITGQNTSGVSLQGSLSGVTLPLKKSTFSPGYDLALKDGSLSNWREVLASADGATFVPTIGDELTFDGAQWVVKATLTLSPAGVQLLHKLAVVKK